MGNSLQNVNRVPNAEHCKKPTAHCTKPARGAQYFPQITSRFGLEWSSEPTQPHTHHISLGPPNLALRACRDVGLHPQLPGQLCRRLTAL